MAQLQKGIKVEDVDDGSPAPEDGSAASEEAPAAASCGAEHCVNHAKGICLSKGASEYKTPFDCGRGGFFSGTYCLSCSEILELAWQEDGRRDRRRVDDRNKTNPKFPWNMVSLGK
eukprot:g11263.t1